MASSTAITAAPSKKVPGAGSSLPPRPSMRSRSTWKSLEKGPMSIPIEWNMSYAVTMMSISLPRLSAQNRDSLGQGDDSLRDHPKQLAAAGLDRGVVGVDGDLHVEDTTEHHGEPGEDER